MLGKEVADYLEKIGCCPRCILIYLGERSELLYGSLQSLDEVIETAAEALSEKLLIEPGTQSHEDEHRQERNLESCEASLTEENQLECSSAGNGGNIQEVDVNVPGKNGIVEHISKKQKCTVCITCIGVLQYGCSASVVKQISEALLSRNHDADAFTLALALPVCLSLRVHRVWTLLMQAFPLYPVKGREDHIGTVKDIWKNLVGPQLETMVDKSFIQGQYLEFIMNVGATYVDDAEDCRILDRLCGKMFSERRKQHKKYASGVYSKQSVDVAFKMLTDKDFLKVCPEPPSAPVEAVSFTHLKWQRESLYMAGRYNKYSRELPQTPWFVDGERKMGSSVQELLCEILNKSVGGEDYRFSSSGREDVDVRCLGNGRPFVIEFLNPCCTKYCQSEITNLQKAVNNSSQLIQVRDLQIVDKKDVKCLKEGEEEKTKAYCALCVARGGYDPALLERLSGMTELTLQQKTPVRVLHRRTLLTRPRIIHEMKASPIDDFFFKLHLTTQAGTYIKEFVHGDLGRTSPNLGSILGLDVDIVALDVERVALDWPPSHGD